MRALTVGALALLAALHYCICSSDGENSDATDRMAKAKFTLNAEGTTFHAKYIVLLSDNREDQPRAAASPLEHISNRLHALRMTTQLRTLRQKPLQRTVSQFSVVSHETEQPIVPSSQTSYRFQLPRGCSLVAVKLLALRPADSDESVFSSTDRVVHILDHHLDIDGYYVVDCGNVTAPVLALRIEYSGEIAAMSVYESRAEATLASGGLWRYKETIGATAGLLGESAYPRVFDALNRALVPTAVNLVVDHNHSHTLISQNTVSRTARRAGMVRSTAVLIVNEDKNSTSWILCDQQVVYRGHVPPALHLPHLAFLLRARLPRPYVCVAGLDDASVSLAMTRAQLGWRTLNHPFDAWLLDAYSIFKSGQSWVNEVALREDECADASPLTEYRSSRAQAAKGAAVLAMLASQCTALEEMDTDTLPLTLDDLIAKAITICFACEYLHNTIPQWVGQKGHPIVTVSVRVVGVSTTVVFEQHAPMLHSAYTLWPVPIVLCSADGTELARTVMSTRSTQVTVTTGVLLQPLNLGRTAGFYRVRYAESATDHFDLSLDADIVLADAFATATIAEYPSLFATVSAVLLGCRPADAPRLWTSVRQLFARYFLADTGQALSVRRPVHRALQAKLRAIVSELNSDRARRAEQPDTGKTSGAEESDTPTFEDIDHVFKGIALASAKTVMDDGYKPLSPDLSGNSSDKEHVPNVFACEEAERIVMSTVFGLQLETADPTAVAAAQRMFFEHVAGACVLQEPLLADVLRAAEVYGEEGEWHLAAQLRSGWRHPGDTFRQRVVRYYGGLARTSCATLVYRPREALAFAAYVLRFIGKLYFNWFCDMAWYIIKSASTAWHPIRPYWDAWFAASNAMLNTFGLTLLCFISVEPQDSAPGWALLIFYRMLVYYWLGLQFYGLVESQRQLMAGWTDRGAILAAIASHGRGEPRWTRNVARGSPAAWRTLVVSYDRFARKQRVRVEKYTEPSMGSLDEDPDDEDRRIDREFGK